MGQFNGERMAFSTNGAGSTGCLHPSYTKVNSRWTTDSLVRAKPITFLEEIMEVNLCDLGLGNGYLDRTPKAQLDKLDYIKSKAFMLPKIPSKE